MFASILLLPAWIKVAIGAILVLGLLQLQHWWQVRGLRNDLAELTETLDKERVATAALKNSMADLMRNRDDLADQLAKQSAAIEDIQRRATVAQQRARADALVAIRAAERRAEELRNVATTTVMPGHEEMNAWLVARFMP